jgi:hypothetical protein
MSIRVISVMDVMYVSCKRLYRHIYDPTTEMEHNIIRVSDILIFKSKNYEESTLENTNKDPPAAVHSPVYPSHASHTSHVSQHIKANSNCMAAIS